MAQAEGARGFERDVRVSDLPVWLWRLLASAQFALALIAVLAVAGLLATVLPQVPEDVRDSPVARALWLETKRDDLGPFTDVFDRLGLFNVVETWWFLTALGLLVLSICVYTVDRFVITWRSIARPRERLPDSFFERAANRFELTAEQSGGAGALEALLRGRRFQVRAYGDGATTYLFADRFAWAQLGNFVSHAALVVFLLGGLVSRTEGFTSSLFIAEGTTSPVFAVSHPEQMQVEVIDAVARFDETGAARDFRSELVVYQGGREVARGEATVNDPLEYNGYRFHQVGYSGDGAAIRVNDAATGRTTYSEVLALDQRVPAPAITVRDASGRTLLSDVIPPSDFVGDASGTLVTVPGSGREFWVGLSQVGEAWQLIVYEREDESTRFVLDEGASRTAGGLSWTFDEPQALPATIAEEFPGDSQRAMVLLAESGGQPFVTLLGPAQGQALTLFPGEPVRVGEREYVFEGRREFSGIRVRKDPGANLIWVAAGLLIAGLLMTFYVPRLRLWARVRADGAVLAAQAERSGVFQAEAKRIMREIEKRGSDT
jgi:cytochrome c biogenesis protein